MVMSVAATRHNNHIETKIHRWGVIFNKNNEKCCKMFVDYKK